LRFFAVGGSGPDPLVWLRPDQTRGGTGANLSILPTVVPCRAKFGKKSLKSVLYAVRRTVEKTRAGPNRRSTGGGGTAPDLLLEGKKLLLESGGGDLRKSGYWAQFVEWGKKIEKKKPKNLAMKGRQWEKNKRRQK